ncbi:hypothetical protein AMAG_04573 [Allomyces macrogynus ATCC 38327]|uniref:Exportin-1/Importin-beta-like domain-containing protein n=1 Tax=Allomyces macrogynus (strain ATCC 38327) TaxID=578462 RepID=A0A0L0S5M1_ALLM3|nr:hypothetical protein AMAG_04573 [Allomyces macrogynus ATCC 38327]|eukprot:KNE57716.1 hypothetical protein AMAG_04573 [Allomyces macrogynus ATCC 38327]
MDLQQTIAPVMEALRVVYDQATSSEARQAAQSYLLQVQCSDLAWDLGWMCLKQLDQIPIQYFGAQSIQIKVSRDFAKVPVDQYDAIRTALLDGVLWTCQAHAARSVMKKLCFAVVTFALHTAPTHWQRMVPSLLELFQQRYAQSPVDVQLALLHALLELLRGLPEEFGRASSLSASHRTQLQQELVDAIPAVLAFLCDLLDHAATEIQIAALQTLASWIQFGIPITNLVPILNKAIVLARNDATFEAALAVLGDVVSHSSNARFEDTLCNGLVPFMVELAPVVAEAVANDDEDKADTLARFVTSLTETFPTWIVKHLDQPQVARVLLPMLLEIIAFPGFPGAEQDVSEIPFHTFFMIQETLSDPDQIAADLGVTGADGTVRPAMSTNSSTDSLVILDQDDDEDDLPPLVQLPPAIEAAAHALFTDLVARIVHKVEWADDAVWAAWSKDRRERWAQFRRAAADTLLVAYYVLRHRMLEWVLQELLTTSPANWKRVEALLFCIRSISEAAPKDGPGAQLVARVLAPDFFAAGANLPLRVRQTLLYIMGGYAEWFHANPAQLAFAVQILTNGLRDKFTLTSAARSLRELCDACRADLVPHLPVLFTAYQEMKAVLPVVERQKVIEALAMVIQQLPSHQIMEPLGAVLEDILVGIQRDLGDSGSEGHDRLLAQFNLLTACVKGIQASEWDLPVQVSESASSAAKLGDQPSFVQLRSLLLQIFAEVARTHPTDLELIPVVANLMELGIKSATLPLVFAPADWVPVFHVLVQSGAVVTTASILEALGTLVTHAPDPLDATVRALVTTVLGNMLQYLVANDGAASRESPDLVDAYLSLTSLVLRYHAIVLTADTAQFTSIVQYAIQCLQLRERPSLKAAAHFLSDFILHSAAEPLHAVVFPSLLAALLHAILVHAPRTIVPNLAEVMYRVITRAPQTARDSLQALLLGPQAVACARLNETDRKAALRVLVGTRQMRRFKDYVRELHVKAQGLDVV